MSNVPASLYPVNDYRHPDWGKHRWAELAEAVTAMTLADHARTAARRLLADRQRQYADLISQHQLDVAEATEPGGKRSYSNPESRAAALRRGLAEDPLAQKLQRAIDQAECDATDADIEFESARRTRQNVLAILHYAASWLDHQTPRLTDLREETRRP